MYCPNCGCESVSFKRERIGVVGQSVHSGQSSRRGVGAHGSGIFCGVVPVSRQGLVQLILIICIELLECVSRVVTLGRLVQIELRLRRRMVSYGGQP